MGRGRLLTLIFLAGCLAAIGLPSTASASSLPSGFRDQVVFSGLEEPTAVRIASDGRVFVAEKTGKILVYNSLGDPTPTEFADLRTDVYDTGDRGVLGLALDPDFPARPYVYALYTYDHLLGEAAPAPTPARSAAAWSG
jgi:glucose/arabinose dehydrogenase